MNEVKLPRKFWNGRRKRPRNSWMQAVKTGMREEGINSIGKMDKKRIE